MKRFFTKKIITAFFFLIVLFVFSFFNLKTSYTSLKEDIQKDFGTKETFPKQFQTAVKDMDSTMSDTVYQKYRSIEIYGYIQDFLDKKEINNFEVVKANDGTLHYTYFTTGPNPVGEIAKRMERLNKAGEKVGSKVMYVMTPDKYIEGKTKFEKGIPYNYANETADNFLKELNKKGVDTLDFRKLMKEDGKYVPDSFYRTDHHWKVETTFWAYTKFVDALEKKYGLVYPHKDIYTNIDNYNQITYKNSHMGSMGRKEGKAYSGVEDFTFIYPKFDTNYYFYGQTGGDDLSTQGRFEQAITFNGLLGGNRDPYDAENDKYFTYMDGNPGFVEINNFNEPDGPKVLFIKDSLMVPVASFFSLGCSKVYMIDPRYYAGNIEDVIDQYKFDYIFVSYTPQNLTDQFFPFYEKTGK